MFLISKSGARKNKKNKGKINRYVQIAAHLAITSTPPRTAKAESSKIDPMIMANGVVNRKLPDTNSAYCRRIRPVEDMK
ncbi:hypothetical protein D3C85_1513340 [compost metagenome]